MKFVCDRCQTRYSIADEKVRQKILRIRCKTCGNVIVVQGERGVPSSAGPAAPPRPPVGQTKIPTSDVAKPAIPPPPPLPTSAASPPAPLGGDVEWYVSVNGTQAGPFSRTDAAKRIVTAKAGQPVHVWKDGMSAWKPAREVSVIARELSILRRPPPPPPPPLPKAPPAASHPDRVGSAPKAGPIAKVSTASKIPESRAPQPRSPVSVAPAAAAGLPEMPGTEVDPEVEFHEDPTTKKASRLPELSKLAKTAAGEKTPPPDHPLPPVVVKLDEPHVASVSVPVSSATSTGAAESTGLDAFSETIQAAAIACTSPLIEGSIASSLASIPAPLQVSADAGMAKPVAMAGLLHRHQGLKFVIAAGVIVALVILIVVVTLRGDGAKRIEPANPVGSAEKVEPPTTEEPATGEAEAPNPKSAHGEKSSQVTRAGIRRGGGSGRVVARPAAPTPEQEAAQRRMAKAPVQIVGTPRPNPFAESARPVSQDQISAVVRNKNNQAALKTCYERALKMDNHLTSGRIDVTVSIGTSGVVQRVIIDAPSSFILIEPCIKAAVKRWVFPPNSEEYGTNFPLIMQGGM